MKPVRFALVCFVLASSAAYLHAQVQDVIYGKPVPLRHLAGTVVDTAGMPVEYAKVELVDPGDHHTLLSTFADLNGKFAFADRKRGQALQVRITREMFNPSTYTIEIRRFGRSRLRAVLHVAQ